MDLASFCAGAKRVVLKHAGPGDAFSYKFMFALYWGTGATLTFCLTEPRW